MVARWVSRVREKEGEEGWMEMHAACPCAPARYPAHPPTNPHPTSLASATRVAHKLMRTATLDWVPIPLWVACAGNALHAGLAQFPDSGGWAGGLRWGVRGGLLGRRNACHPSHLSQPT